MVFLPLLHQKIQTAAGAPAQGPWPANTKIYSALRRGRGARRGEGKLCTRTNTETRVDPLSRISNSSPRIYSWGAEAPSGGQLESNQLLLETALKAPQHLKEFLFLH